MRTDHVTIATACILSVLLVTTSAWTHHKSANEVTKSRNRVQSSKGKTWSTYSRLYHYLLKREKPWLLLEDNDNCFQDWCETSKDCCRGFNICDPSAKICIDCWYGYNCRTSANCCENYPICRKEPGEIYGRCED